MAEGDSLRCLTSNARSLLGEAQAIADARQHETTELVHVVAAAQKGAPCASIFTRVDVGARLDALLRACRPAKEPSYLGRPLLRLTKAANAAGETGIGAGELVARVFRTEEMRAALPELAAEADAAAAVRPPEAAPAPVQRLSLNLATPGVRALVTSAQTLADGRGDRFVEPLHVLVRALAQDAVAAVLRDAGVDVDVARRLASDELAHLSKGLKDEAAINEAAINPTLLAILRQPGSLPALIARVLEAEDANIQRIVAGVAGLRTVPAALREQNKVHGRYGVGAWEILASARRAATLDGREEATTLHVLARALSLPPVARAFRHADRARAVLDEELALLTPSKRPAVQSQLLRSALAVAATVDSKGDSISVSRLIGAILDAASPPSLADLDAEGLERDALARAVAAGALEATALIVTAAPEQPDPDWPELDRLDDDAMAVYEDVRALAPKRGDDAMTALHLLDRLGVAASPSLTRELDLLPRAKEGSDAPVSFALLRILDDAIRRAGAARATRRELEVALAAAARISVAELDREGIELAVVEAILAAGPLRLTAPARTLYEAAGELAFQRGHRVVTPAHLWAQLLWDPALETRLTALGVRMQPARQATVDALAEGPTGPSLDAVLAGSSSDPEGSNVYDLLLALIRVPGDLVVANGGFAEIAAALGDLARTPPVEEEVPAVAAVRVKLAAARPGRTQEQALDVHPWKKGVMWDGRVLRDDEVAAYNRAMARFLRSEAWPKVSGDPFGALAAIDALVRFGEAPPAGADRAALVEAQSEALRTKYPMPAAPDWPELAALRELGPERVELGPPPAHFERIASLDLPPDLRALYAAHDGVTIHSKTDGGLGAPVLVVLPMRNLFDDEGDHSELPPRYIDAFHAGEADRLLVYRKADVYMVARERDTLLEEKRPLDVRALLRAAIQADDLDAYFERS